MNSGAGAIAPLEPPVMAAPSGVPAAVSTAGASAPAAAAAAPPKRAAERATSRHSMTAKIEVHGHGPRSMAHEKSEST